MDSVFNLFVMIGIVALMGSFALLSVAIVKAVTRPRNAFIMLGEYRSLVEREQYGPTRYRERL